MKKKLVIMFMLVIALTVASCGNKDKDVESENKNESLSLNSEDNDSKKKNATKKKNDSKKKTNLDVDKKDKDINKESRDKKKEVTKKKKENTEKRTETTTEQTKTTVKRTEATTKIEKTTEKIEATTRTEQTEVTTEVKETEEATEVTESTETIQEKLPEVVTTDPNYPNPGISQEEYQVFVILNQERRKAGLPPLRIRADAAYTAAQIRAKEISQQFDHVRPNGTSCFTVLQEVNVSYNAVGENIAYGYATSVDVMNGWMNSPGHRGNILGGYSSVAIARYGGYWVQIFLG